MGLKDRGTSKLCRKVRNVVRSVRDIIAILDKAIKDAEKGMTTPGSGWYQLNFLIVGKKNATTCLMTELRAARHGSYSTSSTVSLNDNISDEARHFSAPHVLEYLLQRGQLGDAA